jgi:hypothetical protein
MPVDSQTRTPTAGEPRRPEMRERLRIDAPPAGSPPSRRRRIAYRAWFALLGVILAATIYGDATYDPTVPYQENTLDDVIWWMYVATAAAWLVLGVVLVVLLARDVPHTGPARRSKTGEVGGMRASGGRIVEASDAARR